MVVYPKNFKKVVSVPSSNRLGVGVSRVMGKPFTGTTAFKDSDKDGFVNVIDCEPKNPRKHGWFGDTASKIKEYAGEKYDKWKAERAERAEHVKVIEEKKKEEYWKAREKAELDKVRKEANVKYSYKKPKTAGFSSTLGGLKGSTGLGGETLLPTGEVFVGSTTMKISRKKKKKAKTKSGDGKVVYIQVKGNGKQKKKPTRRTPVQRRENIFTVKI